MMRTPFALLLGALIAFAAPTPAYAQTSDLSQADRREAKRLFNQAHLAYRRGDYEEAILRWQESYELSQEPLIFLSIANAYERLGDARQTLDNLEKWREKAPRREHEELDGRIERLRVRVHAEEAEQKEQEREKARLAAQLADTDDPEPSAEPTTSSEEDVSDVNPWPIVGWSLVGVGGAAVITGVIVDVVAASTRPAEDEACVTQGDKLLCRQSQGSDIDASNDLALAGDITWIAGAALAAGGVAVLLTLARDDADEDETARATRVVPVVGPGATGLLLSARF